MKKLKYLLSAAALLTFASACNHDPDDIVMPATGLTIATHSSVVVNDLTVEEDFTLVWSAVRFAGSPDVEYTVEAKSDRAADFVTLGTTSDTHFTCKNAELFAQLGIGLTGVYDISFCITATSASGETKRETATVRFDYTKITYLYILGEYQSWTPDGEMSRLLQDSEGIFKGFIQIPDAASKEFKLSSQPNWDGTSYGPGEAAGSLLDADAPNFSAEPGLYYMEVDVENLTYVLVPLTSVSLIGEAVGSWNDDIEMTYDAATRTWIGIAKAAADKEYKVRFNNVWDIEVGDLKYNCSLGGDHKDLQLAGGNLVCGNDGITAFTLSLFDYPYTIKEGAVEEKDDVLYLVSSLDDFDYFKAAPMLCLEEGKFYGLFNAVGAASPEVLLSRLQTPLGTRYGGTAASLETYLGGSDATPVASSAGLRFLAADLAADPKTLTDTEITAAAILLKDSTTPIAMTADGSGKWTLTHEFEKPGKFSIQLNGGTIACNGTDYPAVLGGSCTDLVLGGGELNMCKGNNTLVLDCTKSPMTLSINGEVFDPQLYPEKLGVTGNFQGWAPDKAPQLRGNVETGAYYGYVSMFGETEPVEFKFTSKNNWDGPNYGASGTEGTLSNDGGAGNLSIAAGLYRLDVDLEAMTYKTTPLTKVALIGDGVGGWDNDQVELVRDAADGLYKAAGVTASDGKFKVRFNGDWPDNLGGDPNDLTIDGADIPITAGTYDFVLDLTHTPYKITFTAK